MFTPVENLTQGLREASHARVHVTNPKPRYDNEGASDPVADPAQLPRITAFTNEEPILLAKTKHVRGKKETMGQFYARVGLGKAQILAMSKNEIAHFCDVVSTHERPSAPRFVSVEENIQKMELSLTKRVVSFVA